MANRVVSYNVKRVSFFATQYWRSSGGTAEQRSEWAPEGYCVMQGTNGRPYCKNTAKSDIDAFASGMALCFKAVMDRGVRGIALKTHLDDSARHISAWRNSLRFSPLAKYDGWSFADIMLYPLADALGAAITADTDVWFSLQGEMSTTIMMYPREWKSLVGVVRQRVVDAAARRGVNISPGKIRIGMSNNFNKIDTGGLWAPGAQQRYDASMLQQAAPAPAPAGGAGSSSGSSNSSSIIGRDGSAASGDLVPQHLGRSNLTGGTSGSGSSADGAAGANGASGIGSSSGSRGRRLAQDDGTSSGGGLLLGGGGFLGRWLPWARGGGEGSSDSGSSEPSEQAPPPPPPPPPPRPSSSSSSSKTPPSLPSRSFTPLPPPRSSLPPPLSPPPSPSPPGSRAPIRVSPPPPPPPSPSSSSKRGGSSSGAGSSSASHTARADPVPSAPPPQLSAQPLPQNGVLDVSGIRDLHETIDFMGISSYAAMYPNFPLNKLQDAAFMFFDEFRAATTIDLLAIMQRRGLELHYSEYGVGGGVSLDGTRPAGTAHQAAQFPFYGIFGAYSASRDPWRNPDVRSYMHSFYRRTLSWLSQGGGPSIYITACFLWNTGSWDVLGIYPESTRSGQGSYLDSTVAGMVQSHNAAVNGVNRG